VLVYLSKPAESFMELMSVLKEYGSYLGYKLNVQKTQVLSSFYSAPPPRPSQKNLRSKYKLGWDKKTIKYLGINLSMDIASLEEINYSPLKKDIMAITRRWLNEDTLTINEWIDVIYTIFVMERITFQAKVAGRLN
uniref:Reverse transcriptase domain-containing protein n=1 Tax=Oreochromis aureus TaxID=47969 RepID=A0AAZ1XB48_OREAU